MQIIIGILIGIVLVIGGFILWFNKTNNWK
jgi:nitrate reductase gamma subunit